MGSNDEGKNIWIQKGCYLLEGDNGFAVASGKSGNPCQPLEVIDGDDDGREVVLLHLISEVAESDRRVGRLPLDGAAERHESLDRIRTGDIQLRNPSLQSLSNSNACFFTTTNYNTIVFLLQECWFCLRPSAKDQGIT